MSPAKSDGVLRQISAAKPNDKDTCTLHRLLQAVMRDCGDSDVVSFVSICHYGDEVFAVKESILLLVVAASHRHLGMCL